MQKLILLICLLTLNNATGIISSKSPRRLAPLPEQVKSQSETSYKTAMEAQTSSETNAFLESVSKNISSEGLDVVKPYIDGLLATRPLLRKYPVMDEFISKFDNLSKQSSPSDFETAKELFNRDTVHSLFNRIDTNLQEKPNLQETFKAKAGESYSVLRANIESFVPPAPTVPPINKANDSISGEILTALNSKNQPLLENSAEVLDNLEYLTKLYDLKFPEELKNLSNELNNVLKNQNADTESQLRKILDENKTTYDTAYKNFNAQLDELEKQPLNQITAQDSKLLSLDTSSPTKLQIEPLSATSVPSDLSDTSRSVITPTSTASDLSDTASSVSDLSDTESFPVIYAED